MNRRYMHRPKVVYALLRPAISARAMHRHVAVAIARASQRPSPAVLNQTLAGIDHGAAATWAHEDRMLVRPPSLKGRPGDAGSIILSAVGHDFRRILAWLREPLGQFLELLWRTLASPTQLDPAS